MSRIVASVLTFAYNDILDPAPPYAVVADLANETTVRVNHTRLPGLGVTFYTIGLVEEGHLREIATVQGFTNFSETNLLYISVYLFQTHV